MLACIKCLRILLQLKKMVLKIFFLIFVFFVNVNLVKSECDSYSSCVGSFISNFFSNVNYFKNTKRDDLNDTSEFGEDALNNILVNVSTFLQSEWDGTYVSHIFQNVENDTTIYVREINIGDIDLDNIDIYNNIFYENDTFEIPKEVNTQNINFTINEIDSVPVINSFENHTKFLQPLVFNFSEILTPVNFSASLFPQIKIEHFQSTNEKDQSVNEISDVADFHEYYDFNEDNSTDYPVIDYIDLYKDTTNEITESKTTERNENEYNVNVTEKNKHYVKDSLVEVEKYEDNTLIYNQDNVKEDNITRAIFPWVAAIFIKNESSEQFKYYCDGALVTDKLVVTAASCIQNANSSVKADDIILLLGKISLQTTSDNERLKRIEAVYVHENFTKGVNNDVAMLALEDAVDFSESIQPARLGYVKDYDEAYTTGWAFTGELSPIKMQKENKRCAQQVEEDHRFCAVYDSNVTVCPSYGGLYVVEKNNTWYLQGIRTDDPTDREICVNKPLTFSALESFSVWLAHFIP